MPLFRRILPLLMAALGVASAQTAYDGPRPAKPDIPYLKHASNLVETESGEAKEQKRKDDITYIIDGAASSARTPLASPIFLFLANKIAPEKFGLYRLDVKDGHREVTFGPKKQPRAYRVEVSHLEKNLYRLEVDESLDPGEYSLSPEGSNTVFCFQVY